MRAPAPGCRRAGRHLPRRERATRRPSRTRGRLGAARAMKGDRGYRGLAYEPTPIREPEASGRRLDTVVTAVHAVGCINPYTRARLGIYRCNRGFRGNRGTVVRAATHPTPPAGYTHQSGEQSVPLTVPAAGGFREVAARPVLLRLARPPGGRGGGR